MIMNDNELCNWLIENSSGIYRPAADAAQRIISLKSETHHVVSVAIGQLNDRINICKKALEDCGDSGSALQELESMREYLEGVHSSHLEIKPKPEGKLRCRIKIYDPAVKEPPYEFIILKENVFVDKSFSGDDNGRDQYHILISACNDLGYEFKSYSISQEPGYDNDIMVYGGLVPR